MAIDILNNGDSLGTQRTKINKIIKSYYEAGVEGSITDIFPLKLLINYALFPETFTSGELATVESDTGLMAIYAASRINEYKQDISTKLLQETIISTSAQQISITPPDYSAYNYLRIIVTGTTSAESSIYMRINNDSTAGKYNYSSTGYTPGSLTSIPFGGSDGQFYTEMTLGNFVPSKISGHVTAYSNDDSSYGSFSHNYTINISSLSSIQIFAESGKTINTGTKIKIYGVKT